MMDFNNIFSFSFDPDRTADMQIYGVSFPSWGSRQRKKFRNIANRMERSNIF